MVCDVGTVSYEVHLGIDWSGDGSMAYSWGTGECYYANSDNIHNAQKTQVLM